MLENMKEGQAIETPALGVNALRKVDELAVTLKAWLPQHICTKTSTILSR